VALLNRVIHKFFGKGNHVNSGKHVKITNFYSKDPHKNVFKTRVKYLDYCETCNRYHGTPLYDFDQSNQLVEINQELYTNMIGLGSSRVTTIEYPNGQVIVKY